MPDSEILRRLEALEARVAQLEGQPAKEKTPKVDPKRAPTSPQALRVAAIFHRRPSTYWSPKEISTYKRIGAITEEDLACLEAYYQSDCGILRRDLSTFLNNYAGELDRARAWQKEQDHPRQNGSHQSAPVRATMRL